MQKFLNFDKLITPAFIKMIFWIGIAFSLFLGVTLISNSFSGGLGAIAEAFIGLIFIIVGPFIVRIYCGIVMVIFKGIMLLGKN